jgi:hypothetical protein
MALNTPAQVVADWIELRDDILPLVEEEGLPSGALDTAVALAVIQGSGGGGGGASASEIGDATNTAIRNGGALPTSLASLPSFAATPTFNLGTAPEIVLGAGSASVGAFTNLALGALNDAAATSPTGNFSLVSLAKRDAARRDVTLINLRPTVTNSGDTSVVNAPGAGLQIAIRRLRVQNGDDLTRSILIRGGATTVAGCQGTIIGTGLSEVYDASNELVLPENTALVINLSVAGSVTASIGYYVRSVATGLPV